MAEDKNNTRHEKTSIKEIFCASNGYLSSKRVLGTIIILAVIVMCCVDLYYERTISDNLKDITEIMILCATGLLGITSVTNIWKGGNKTINNIETKNTTYNEN